MRGHGITTGCADVRTATVAACFLEESAELQLQMLTAVGPHLILRLTNSPGPGEILVYLIVQVFAVSDDKESPIAGHLAQNLLRKENH